MPEELREISDKVERLTRIYREDMLMAVLTDGKKWTIAEIQTRLRRAGLPSMSNKEMRKRLKTLVEEKRLVSVPTQQQGCPEAYGLPQQR